MTNIEFMNKEETKPNVKCDAKEGNDGFLIKIAPTQS